MHERDPDPVSAADAAAAGESAADLVCWLRDAPEETPELLADLLEDALGVADFALARLLVPPAPDAEPEPKPKKPKRAPKASLPVGKPAQAQRLEAFFAEAPSTATPSPEVVLAIALHLGAKLLERYLKART